MADDIRIPIPARSLSNSNTLPPKAIGVPCKNVSGRMKMMMFHPSQPNTRLNYCADVLDHIKRYGFAENIESGTPDTIEFMYDAFPGIEITGDCPTPKLPRSKIDGLHPYTYKAFLDALNYYLPRKRPQELFILRYVILRFFPSSRVLTTQ